MTGLLGALQFLTRVPIRLARPVPHARAVPWFAIAGVLIGTDRGDFIREYLEYREKTTPNGAST